MITTQATSVEKGISLTWYDHELGYTYTLVEHVVKTGKTIK